MPLTFQPARSSEKYIIACVSTPVILTKKKWVNVAAAVIQNYGAAPTTGVADHHQSTSADPCQKSLLTCQQEPHADTGCQLSPHIIQLVMQFVSLLQHCVHAPSSTATFFT
jgi:hypothetical protein